MENLFGKNFPGLFPIATNDTNDEIVWNSFTAGEQSEWIMQLNIFAVLQT